MKENCIDISMVLDRSGSMAAIVNDVIGGVNTFIDAQKQPGASALFTLCQFDDHYETLLDGAPIGDAKPLTPQTYVPRGSTALWDAIGRTINTTGARLAKMSDADRPSKVVFVIVTDGMENSSKEFGKAKIKEMIEHQTNKYQWQFVFLAANQDAILKGAELGMRGSNSMTFAANHVGTQSAFGSLSSNVRNYAVGAATSPEYTLQDRSKQEEALKVSITNTKV